MASQDWEQLPVGPGDFKGMLAAYGLAAYHAGACEKKLAILTAMIDSAKGKRDIRQRFTESMTDLDRRTLGRIIRSLDDIVELPDATKRSLERMVDERNYLVHHFFWEHRDDELSQRGRESMSTELMELAGRFSGMASQIEGVTQDVIKAVASAKGIPPEEIDRRGEAAFREMQEQASRRDRGDG